VPFIHCARYVVIGDSARQPATASEDKTGNGIHLGSKKTLYYALGQTHEFEVMKRAVEISIRLRKVTGHSGEVAPPQTNERRDIKRPALRKDNSSKLIGEPFGMSGLKEQREQMGVITVRTEPQGGKEMMITDITSTALGKEEMAVSL
jgi:hypothetical protein